MSMRFRCNRCGEVWDYDAETEACTCTKPDGMSELDFIASWEDVDDEEEDEP